MMVKINAKMTALFAAAPVRPATLLDRTTAAARDITEAATLARNEATARLKAKRLELQAIVGAPDKAPSKAPAAKRKPPKV
jgi:hypothetical protein